MSHPKTTRMMNMTTKTIDIYREYSTAEVCNVSGLTYRVLDHLIRTDQLFHLKGCEPEVGSGHRRKFDLDGLVTITLFAHVRDQVLFLVDKAPKLGMNRSLTSAFFDWASELDPGEYVHTGRPEKIVYHLNQRRFFDPDRYTETRMDFIQFNIASTHLRLQKALFGG